MLNHVDVPCLFTLFLLEMTSRRQVTFVYECSLFPLPFFMMPHILSFLWEKGIRNFNVVKQTGLNVPNNNNILISNKITQWDQFLYNHVMSFYVNFFFIMCFNGELLLRFVP